jgi:hypothetical protein
MSKSQNEWPVLLGDSPLLYTWIIPTKSGIVHIRMRNGSAGFLLALWAMWYSNHIEPLKGKILDDWGWNFRPIRGETSGYSNHASGTAIDLNATKHPLGKVGTLGFRIKVRGLKSMVASLRIHKRLVIHFKDTIRWGGEYHNRKDEMHYEINVSLSVAEKRARRLMRTRAGKKLLEANPSQRKVILS